MRINIIRLTALLVLFSVIGVSVAAETATLTVAASLGDCKVSIDDKIKGTTPFVVQLAPGAHNLVVTGGKDKFEAILDLKGSERIVAYADFKEDKKINVYKTENDITAFVAKAASLVKFNEYYDKAVKLHEEKKLDWAIDALKKALSFYTDEKTEEMLIQWKIERLPEGFVYIRGGQFNMGQAVTEFADDYRQIPEHPVIVSDFAISVFEITNDEFAKFIEATDHKTTVENMGSGAIWNEKAQTWEVKEGVSWKSPKGSGSNIRGDGKLPVCQVSWPDAIAYCDWRATMEGVPKGSVRLPTEAEWEYCARGKEGRPFPWGDEAPFKYDKANPDDYKDLKKYAVVDSKWAKEVGKMPKGKSPEGVFDLIGNVWEWCFDRGDDTFYTTCKEKGVVKDPVGPPLGNLRTVRGGGYDSDPDSARTTKRFFVKEEASSTNIGFRVVFVP